MYWKLMSLSLVPIGLSGIVIANGTSPILDYGGLGLAAAVVGFLCKYLKDLTRQHREERRELLAVIEEGRRELKTIIEADTKSRNEFTGILRIKPCLMKKEDD